MQWMMLRGLDQMVHWVLVELAALEHQILRLFFDGKRLVIEVCHFIDDSNWSRIFQTAS